MSDFSNHDREQLARFAQYGLTLGEIGDEMGRTADQVRHALRRLGMRAVYDNEKTLRERVGGMKPLDAVEFLLGCVENLSPGLCGQGHATDDWHLDLTPTQRRILICLHDAAGAVLSKDALLSSVYFDRPGDLPGVKILDVLVCKMRPCIPESRGRIETVWGQGLRWVSA